MMEYFRSFPFDRWEGPFDEQSRDNALFALESGRLLLFPHLPFVLTRTEYAIFTDYLFPETRKNISLDPASGRLGGAALSPPQETLLVELLSRFGQTADRFLRTLFPDYAASLVRARASYRPAEIAGRDYTPRHDDRRLHVDAFPTRPTRGHRILRLFTNIDPEGIPRVWQIGEPFEAFAARFLPRTREPYPGESWLLACFGLTKSRRSAYDFLMLGLHDEAKKDVAYQKAAAKVEHSFSPGTTWICYTDMVPHAALSGRNALEQTFVLPIEAMAHPEQSPVRILERLVGHTLV